LQTRPRIEKKVIMPCCHMVGLINSYSPLYMHSSICIFWPLIFKELKLFPFMLETNNGSYCLTFMMKVCLYSVILCAWLTKSWLLLVFCWNWHNGHIESVNCGVFSMMSQDTCWKWKYNLAIRSPPQHVKVCVLDWML
jgi:hypothetical protein